MKVSKLTNCSINKTKRNGKFQCDITIVWTQRNIDLIYA